MKKLGNFHGFPSHWVMVERVEEGRISWPRIGSSGSTVGPAWRITWQITTVSRREVPEDAGYFMIYFKTKKNQERSRKIVKMIRFLCIVPSWEIGSNIALQVRRMCSFSRARMAVAKIMLWNPWSIPWEDAWINFSSKTNPISLSLTWVPNVTTVTRANTTPGVLGGWGKWLYIRSRVCMWARSSFGCHCFMIFATCVTVLPQFLSRFRYHTWQRRIPIGTSSRNARVRTGTKVILHPVQNGDTPRKPVKQSLPSMASEAPTAFTAMILFGTRKSQAWEHHGTSSKRIPKNIQKEEQHNSCNL